MEKPELERAMESENHKFLEVVMHTDVHASVDTVESDKGHQEFKELFNPCRDDADLGDRIRDKMAELEDELVKSDRQYLARAETILAGIDEVLDGFVETE